MGDPVVRPIVNESPRGRGEDAAVRTPGAAPDPPRRLARSRRIRWSLALVVLLASPSSVLAQTAGVITSDSSTINIAQCTGTPSTGAGLSDRMTVGLRWTVALDGSTPQFTTGGVYRLYVANQQPAAGQGSGTSCTQPASSSSITFRSAQVGSDLDAAAQTTASTHSFDTQEIVSAAGLDCTAPSAATIYLCVQWFDSSGTSHGWANTTLTLDRTSPAAPTGLHASGGDGALYLGCSAGDSSTSSFKARATSTTDPGPHFSNQASSCGDLVVDGLQNGVTYGVVVFGMDGANNPSPASDAIQAQPVPTDDFWTHYKNDGGRDQGGCSTGAAASLAGAALWLLALRRRRP